MSGLKFDMIELLDVILVFLHQRIGVVESVVFMVETGNELQCSASAENSVKSRRLLEA